MEANPGIVLYTVVNRELIEEIERRCREMKVPSLHVLQPIMTIFESYLRSSANAGGRRPTSCRR